MSKYVIAEYLTRDEAIAYLRGRTKHVDTTVGERAILDGIIRLLREGGDG